MQCDPAVGGQRPLRDRRPQCRLYFKDRTDCLHAFIYANLEARAERIVRLYGDSEKTPIARLNEKDKRRKVNYQHYTGRNWGQAQNYDICLDSSSLGIETCVDILVKLAQGD